MQSVSSKITNVWQSKALLLNSVSYNIILSSSYDKIYLQNQDSRMRGGMNRIKIRTLWNIDY